MTREEWERIARKQLGVDPDAMMPMPVRDTSIIAMTTERFGDIQRGLSRLDPMQRSSPETVSCVFCGADKGHSYVTGDRTPHAPDCEWRLAREARGIPWESVL